MKQSRKREGAALFVVLMVIMAGTASAVFAANAVSHEVRGTGFARQQMQTRYAARAGLLGALEWFDIFGPETVREIMLTKGSTAGTLYTCDTGTITSCYPEPPLANNRRAYRIYPEHFEALMSQDGGITAGLFENRPYEADFSFGANSAHTPIVVIDLYDEHVVSKLAPGAAAQGGTKFKYLRTTVTARGRARLGVGTDQAHAEDNGRERHETAADMRAYVVSGPFITGSL
ncbi:MAG: hypothetical protein WCE62_02435 [Polyangiales bacterium]